MLYNSHLLFFSSIFYLLLLIFYLWQQGDVFGSVRMSVCHLRKPKTTAALHLIVMEQITRHNNNFCTAKSKKWSFVSAKYTELKTYFYTSVVEATLFIILLHVTFRSYLNFFVGLENQKKMFSHRDLPGCWRAMQQDTNERSKRNRQIIEKQGNRKHTI